MRAPDVSVVIPTYNRAVQVERAIASIHEDLDVEILVVDDCSSDDTARRLSARSDIVYVRLACNAGAAAARNAGIAKARSAYIAFLDSDDLRIAGTLARQLAVLRDRSDCALVHAAFRYAGQRAGPAKEPPAGRVYETLFRHNAIAPSTAIVKAAVFAELGGFNETFRRSEEWELWLRICSRYAVCALNEEVAVLDPPNDDSHLSGDPVAIELTSIEAVRLHMRTPYCALSDPIERRRVFSDFVRTRIDLMIWKVLSRGATAPVRLRWRCVFRSFVLSPRHMLRGANLKNAIKLLAPRRPGRPAALLD